MWESFLAGNFSMTDNVALSLWRLSAGNAFTAGQLRWCTHTENTAWAAFQSMLWHHWPTQQNYFQSRVCVCVCVCVHLCVCVGVTCRCVCVHAHALIDVKCLLARRSPPTSADHSSSGRPPLLSSGHMEKWEIIRGGDIVKWKSIDEVGSTVAHERGGEWGNGEPSSFSESQESERGMWRWGLYRSP